MSNALFTPLLASASMSAHFEVLERPGDESHFLRRLSFSVRSGSKVSRCSARSLSAQGSCVSRMSAWKCGARSSRLRLRTWSVLYLLRCMTLGKGKGSVNRLNM